MLPAGCVYGCGMASVMALVCCVISPAGRVYGWRLVSVRVVVSGADFWWPELIPLCLASFVSHPVAVCGSLSSAGRFWPARLLSLRLGGGEVSGGFGVGRGVGRSRGLVGRVPEEQPSAAGLGLAALKHSSACWLVGLSWSVWDWV